MTLSDQQLPREGDVIAGKYEVESILGSGGMGAVFKVRHAVTGKTFAVKWLLPELSTSAETIERFIRESKVAGRVDHPNVVQVYDVGQDGATFFMVMELLHGEPLSRRIAAGALPPSAACRILIPVARGLAAAHEAGIIHRDLKPDNIFLCHSPNGEERPKLLDFGISKMNPLDHELDASITRDGVVMGTPHYMAPEQVRSQPVDARTDVYALGVILYQMLSGALPFPAENFSDLLFRIMVESPRPLAELAPGLPPELIAVVSRAMAREPERRFESVAEFGRALEPFAEGMAFEVAPASLPARPSAPSIGPRTPVASDSPQRNPSRSTGPRTPLATESQMRSAAGRARARSSIWPWVISALAALVIGVSLGQWISQRRAQDAAKAGHIVTPRPIAGAQPSGDSRAVYVPPAPLSVQGLTPADGAPPKAAESAAPIEALPKPAVRANAPAEPRRQDRAREDPAASQAAAARAREHSPADAVDRVPVRRNRVRLREDEF